MQLIRGARLIALMLGVVLTMGALLAGYTGTRTSSALDRELQTEAQSRAVRLQEAFDRGRSIMLVAANNPVHTDVLRRRAAGAPRDPHLISRANDSLDHLGTLYPGQIGEACLIDVSGTESARVVHGVAAHEHDLSDEEAKTPFFAPTLALPPGEVHQARPYVSPDTDEWVIANAAPLYADGKLLGLLHFEVTVESIRASAVPQRPEHVASVVERDGYGVVLDSSRPQRKGDPQQSSLRDCLRTRLC